MLKYNVISQSNSWIEGKAIEQLKQVSNFKDMIKVCGMPDLHPGKGAAVGASYVTENNMVYPYLIGSDIGCGMSVSTLDIDLHKIKLNKLEKNLRNLESVQLDLEDDNLGYVGGGNHFVEIQKVISTNDTNQFKLNQVLTTIHTGSRGLGENILRTYVSKNQSNSVDINSQLGQWYLNEHDRAIKFAKENRIALLKKLKVCLDINANEIFDIYHNYLEPYGTNAGQWIHRKGAASSLNKLVVIPGSRGDYSYIVKPKQRTDDINLSSLAHGAGRKWSRSECKCKIENKFKFTELSKTKLGSIVICDDRNLMYEEVPEAYKKISSVIDDLISFDLIEVVAIVSPIITYKCAK